MINKKIFAVILLIFSLSLFGCESREVPSEASYGGEVPETSAVVFDSSEMFTDRDLRTDYDTASAVEITGTGDGFVCNSSAVKAEENTAVISAEGVYILKGTVTDGQIKVEADDTAKIQLVLDGFNCTKQNSAAIYIKSADKVFVTAAKDSENTLSSEGEFAADGDINVDGTVFAKSDLVFNGEGVLNINCETAHGAVSKDDLKITAGTYYVNSNSKGISGKNSVRICGGEIEIASGNDGIHSEHTEDTEKGFVYISGGVIKINAEDDGINCTGSCTLKGGQITVSATDDGVHSDKNLAVCGSDIKVSQSYEGLEGLTIDITDGDINLTASDDGLNSARGNDGSGFTRPGGGRDNPFQANPDCYIKISGGKLRINAKGDGIDSNGGLYVSGGETYVSGPTSGGNGALDYGGEAVISGGVFVATGAQGMAQNFGSNSTQPTMLVNTGNASGELKLLCDGEALLSYTPEKNYQCAVISCPEMKVGETYTVSCSAGNVDMIMSTVVYGGGMGGGFPGGRPDGGKPDRPDGGRPSRP